MTESSFNPFAFNVPFLYPLKTSENLTIFWCFQGVEKVLIGIKWVKQCYRLCTNNYTKNFPETLQNFSEQLFWTNVASVNSVFGRDLQSFYRNASSLPEKKLSSFSKILIFKCCMNLDLWVKCLNGGNYCFHFRKEIF